MAVRIGVPRERAEGETRVAMVPAVAERFAGLGAEYAVSTAHDDNGASLRVSRRLGYAEDGFERHVVRGAPQVTRRLRLDRAAWAAHRRIPVEVHGLEPCLPLFGLPG